LELRKLKKARQGIDSSKLSIGESKKKRRRDDEEEELKGGLQLRANVDSDE
jgi:hypothetical protein